MNSRLPRRAHETRRRVLENAYRLFSSEGFDRAGVDAVADAAGVTKRILYNPFPSKDQLIAAVPDTRAELATAEIRRWCGTSPATAEELVGKIFGGLRAWARTPGWRGSGFTRAAMELARTPDHPARHAAAAQKLAVERALVGALATAGAAEPVRLAQQLVLLIEGANVRRLIHGDEPWFDAAEAAARALVRGR